MAAGFVVKFAPHVGIAYHDAQPDMYNDWQANEGAKMDAPRWIPTGGARSESAGVVAGQEAHVDAGHQLRDERP